MTKLDENVMTLEEMKEHLKMSGGTIHCTNKMVDFIWQAAQFPQQAELGRLQRDNTILRQKLAEAKGQEKLLIIDDPTKIKFLNDEGGDPCFLIGSLKGQVKRLKKEVERLEALLELQGNQDTEGMKLACLCEMEANKTLNFEVQRLENELVLPEQFEALAHKKLEEVRKENADLKQQLEKNKKLIQGKNSYIETLEEVKNDFKQKHAKLTQDNISKRMALLDCQTKLAECKMIGHSIEEVLVETKTKYKRALEWIVRQIEDDPDYKNQDEEFFDLMFSKKIRLFKD